MTAHPGPCAALLLRRLRAKRYREHRQGAASCALAVFSSASIGTDYTYQTAAKAVAVARVFAPDVKRLARPAQDQVERLLLEAIQAGQQTTVRDEPWRFLCNPSLSRRWCKSQPQ